MSPTTSVACEILVVHGAPAPKSRKWRTAVDSSSSSQRENGTDERHGLVPRAPSPRQWHRCQYPRLGMRVPLQKSRGGGVHERGVWQQDRFEKRKTPPPPKKAPPRAG